ncbi:hypothetical protein [Natronorubrum sp. FCH18a]|uniref:hypothetical protein n=1 Tax=Natronorubrum sp. FCH18a TaxID=3447018 RepID=UPI003F51A4AD
MRRLSIEEPFRDGFGDRVRRRQSIDDRHLEPSSLGVRGVVRAGKPPKGADEQTGAWDDPDAAVGDPDEALADADEETRERLRELGYLE